MSNYLFNNYGRFDVAFTHGEGCYLYDTHQSPYLDFGAGIAVSALGHAHPKLVAAIQDQAGKLLHCSNLYNIPQQEQLAEQLCNHSFADKVLFCNTGLEANECALKLVRKYHHSQNNPEKSRFLAIEGAFHGRSLAQIGASPVGKMVDGFGPLPDWFDIAPADDLAALEATITDETAAIILEPLQGDGGGIHFFAPEYIQGIRALCDKHGLLMVLDEIQCGNGRTGKIWCHEHSGITPDIMTTAKGLGGGFPIGAVLAKADIAKAIDPGSHGTTFGGNPLACAAGLVVIEEITQTGFMDEVANRGEQLSEGLQKLVGEFPKLVSEQLGIGLMQGLRCTDGMSNISIVSAALKAGLLIVPAGKNVLRFVPPLTVSEAEIQQALEILHVVLQKVSV